MMEVRFLPTCCPDSVLVLESAASGTEGYRLASDGEHLKSVLLPKSKVGVHQQSGTNSYSPVEQLSRQPSRTSAQRGRPTDGE